MGILRDLVEQKAFDIVKKRIEREESQALTNKSNQQKSVVYELNNSTD